MNPQPTELQINGCHYNTENSNFFNILPKDLQLGIFEILVPQYLLKISSVCKQWNDLSHDTILWKKLGKKIGLTHFTTDIVCDYRFGLAFSQLNFKQNLGEKVFSKLEKLAIWNEDLNWTVGSIHFGNQEVRKQTNWNLKISNLTKWQTIKDGKDHFGKQLLKNRIVFILITADRAYSKIFHFNLSFKPNSTLVKDACLGWHYKIGSNQAFFLPKGIKKPQRELELAKIWKNVAELLDSAITI